MHGSEDADNGRYHQAHHHYPASEPREEASRAVKRNEERGTGEPEEKRANERERKALPVASHPPQKEVKARVLRGLGAWH